MIIPSSPSTLHLNPSKRIPVCTVFQFQSKAEGELPKLMLGSQSPFESRWQEYYALRTWHSSRLLWPRSQWFHASASVVSSKSFLWIINIEIPGFNYGNDCHKSLIGGVHKMRTIDAWLGWWTIHLVHKASIPVDGQLYFLGLGIYTGKGDSLPTQPHAPLAIQYINAHYNL